MTDEVRTQLEVGPPAEAAAEPVPAPTVASRPAWLRVLGVLATDVGIGVLLAAMIIVTLLFSSGVSKFVYIDF